MIRPDIPSPSKPLPRGFFYGPAEPEKCRRNSWLGIDNADLWGIFRV